MGDEEDEEDEEFEPVNCDEFGGGKAKQSKAEGYDLREHLKAKKAHLREDLEEAKRARRKRSPLTPPPGRHNYMMVDPNNGGPPPNFGALQPYPPGTAQVGDALALLLLPTLLNNLAPIPATVGTQEEFIVLEEVDDESPGAAKTVPIPTCETVNSSKAVALEGKKNKRKGKKERGAEKELKLPSPIPVTVGTQEEFIVLDEVDDESPGAAKTVPIPTCE